VACWQEDLAIRKFQRVVMNRRIILIDLPKDCGLVTDIERHGHERTFLTSSAKDNSVPGSKQTATFLSSDAAIPRVLQPNRRVVNLSSTLAGRVLTALRL
jgi:hypothetical protein